MSRVQPPDGHWHRRTDKPVKTIDRHRWYGCTHDGCPWVVIVAPDHSETRHRQGYGAQT